MIDPIHRAQRASLLREILDPIIAECRRDYTDKIVAIASSELDPRAREQKLTSLSVATRILDNISQGLIAVVKDGEMAHQQQLRADKIEAMSAPARKLFNVIPY